MGMLHDDVVIITEPEKEDNPTVITINCPDKTGLGCDLCRILLFFGLTILRGDVSTDGKWCFVVFWVVGKEGTRWSLLKERLVETCPSFYSASVISYYRQELQYPKIPDVFLLKFCCYNRKGILHGDPFDVTGVLCELELTIKKVKVSTTPDEKVMDLFFVTDTRELLHTNMRKNEVSAHLKDATGYAMISCDIEMVGPEITECSKSSSFLPSLLIEDKFHLQMSNELPSGLVTSSCVSVNMDNSLSTGHTLVQIMCEDHKGLLYDIMRTLKDYNIQIAYGRFSLKEGRNCEIDLFIVQADGKKILDPSKQNSLRSRLQMELLRPLRVTVVSKGPDAELLVANPVELSGKGRPLVFYDITLALKTLNTGIFSAKIGRHLVKDREWEVYRVLLDEGDGLPVPRDQIEEGVWKMLMGWE